MGTLEAPESPEVVRDLKRPDALIESASLSQLPKAVLEVPLLRDVLTEDFVFYYENNADRLGLTGTLRRIVYEHDLTLKDSVIEELLDQPAQVALWRGADGRLRDFMVVLKRGGLAKVLEPLAKVAADDTQLKKVSEIQVKGAATPVYSLRYGAEKTLLFVSRGDQMLVLSNPKMLFPNPDYDNLGEPDAAVAKDLGSALEGEPLFAKDFALEPRGELKQRITLSAGVLAMGYQRLIPTFAGVRFEQGKDGWHSYLALNEVARQPDLDFTPVWQAMPMGASACVALPVTPGLYDNMLVKLGAEQKMAAAFSEHLSGAAGLCWYPESRLHSPLLAVKLDAPASPELDDQLGKLFGSMIGAYEANVEAGASRWKVVPKAMVASGSARSARASASTRPARRRIPTRSAATVSSVSACCAMATPCCSPSTTSSSTRRAIPWPSATRRWPTCCPRMHWCRPTWRPRRCPSCSSAKPSTACRRTSSRCSATPPIRCSCHA